MKKETIKDWCKKWSIEDIIGNVFSQGMRFQATNGLTNSDAQKYQKIIIKELKSRVKLP